MDVYVVYNGTPDNLMAVFTRDTGGLNAANVFIGSNGGTLGEGTLSDYSLVVTL